MRASLAMALLLALAPAGCLEGGSDRATDPGAGDPSQGLSGSPVVFQDCIGWTHVAYVPGDWVDAKLPEGYTTARGFSVPGLPFVTPDVEVTYPALAAFECKSITMPDGTYYPGAIFARSTVYLEQAGGHEGGNDNDDYVFEIFLDRATLPAFAALLEHYGWPVHDAEVTLGDRGFDVHADGVTYEARPDPANDPGPAEPRADEPRMHHVGANATYADFGDTLYLSFTYYSVLTASGGFFGGLWPMEGAATFAGVGQGYGISGPAAWSWAGT